MARRTSRSCACWDWPSARGFCGWANAVLRALREEKPGVVFLARDAGDGLAQRVARRLGESTLERTLLSSQELALAFGRERLAVVSVHDRGFVSGLRKQLAIRGEDS